MLALYVTLHALLNTTAERTRDRLTDAREREDGIATLELVVLGLGLFLLAGVVIGVVNAAVNSRTAQIK